MNTKTKIPFTKIANLPVEFSVGAEILNQNLQDLAKNIIFSGKIENSQQLSARFACKIAHLSGTLSGEISLCDDKSGEFFSQSLNENIDFFLSEKPVNIGSSELLEIIECNGEIDLAELLAQELEFILCDYHSQSSEEFEEREI